MLLWVCGFWNEIYFFKKRQNFFANPILFKSENLLISASATFSLGTHQSSTIVSFRMLFDNIFKVAPVRKQNVQIRLDYFVIKLMSIIQKYIVYKTFSRKVCFINQFYQLSSTFTVVSIWSFIDIIKFVKNDPPILVIFQRPEIIGLEEPESMAFRIQLMVITAACLAILSEAGKQPSLGRCRSHNCGGNSRLHYYICCNNCDEDSSVCQGKTYQTASTENYCVECGVDNGNAADILTEEFNCCGCRGQSEMDRKCLSAWWVINIPGFCWTYSACFKTNCKKRRCSRNAIGELEIMPNNDTFCGNGVCEADEDIYNCPLDCCATINPQKCSDNTKCLPTCCGDSTCCTDCGNATDSTCNNGNYPTCPNGNYDKFRQVFFLILS